LETTTSTNLVVYIWNISFTNPEGLGKIGAESGTGVSKLYYCFASKKTMLPVLEMTPF